MSELLNDDMKLFVELLNQDEEIEENICLITNEKLENNYIKLNCNHKFNYLALYNEVVYQKTKKILDNSRLKINEIKCPYCRDVTDKLLPHYKYYNIPSVRGVTNPEKYVMKIQECEHIRNNKKCSRPGCITKDGIFCNIHMKIKKLDEEIIENMDEKFYKTYKQKTLKDLKEELRHHKLKLSGNKGDLINRLYIHYIKTE
tara:strand:- start:2248 stop:2850 length:603 start_codon:yes stop_codon:yes gene_type:complete